MSAHAKNSPAHVAIIMDGNGRWAKRRGLPRLAGHKAGADAVKRTVEAARELKISHLTLYAFSIENWRRPTDEIEGLMRLLKEAVANELDELRKQGIKLNLIGRWRELAPDIVDALENALEVTAGNNAGTLTLALNYSGRTEITDAVRKIAGEAVTGKIKPSDISEDDVAGALYTAGLPPVDLLIRTSGEMRISNFLLWQVAYTEIWVTPVFWPDFGEKELLMAVEEFKKRRRRYGGLDKEV